MDSSTSGVTSTYSTFNVSVGIKKGNGMACLVSLSKMHGGMRLGKVL